MLKFFQKALWVIICISATNAYSQTKGTTAFGIHAGYNSPTISGKNKITGKHRDGFNAGISVEQYFSENWSLKVRAMYDQKSDTHVDFQSQNLSVYTTYFLDYLTVPVLVNWHFGRKNNFYLNLGPYASFLLSPTTEIMKRDLRKSFSTEEFGVNVGAGIKFPLSRRVKIFLELNRASGLTDILRDNRGSALKNNVTAINGGINF